MDRSTAAVSYIEVEHLLNVQFTDYQSDLFISSCQLQTKRAGSFHLDATYTSILQMVKKKRPVF